MFAPPTEGAVSTATVTPAIASTEHATFTFVRCSPMNFTATGNATTGVSAPMISATAMLVYCSVMKKMHRLRPNSTPEIRLALSSPHDGQRCVANAMIAKMVEKGMTYVEPPKPEIEKMYSEKYTKGAFDWFVELSGRSGTDGRRIVAELRKILGK